MRRNSKVNPKLSKIVARQNYRDRQIDKWWKWSWQQRGRIKYKELVKYQDQYKLKAVYEGATFEVSKGFEFTNTSYERTGNGKGEFKQRGRKKILPIKYTPDFIGYTNGADYHYIIECKGRANESFPIRWKLFKKYVSKNLPNTTLFKPQNQKECDETIRLILSYLK